jgi:hypothetical protein
METLLPITVDPEVLSGTPVFRGTRVPVQTLVDYIKGLGSQINTSSWHGRGSGDSRGKEFLAEAQRARMASEKAVREEGVLAEEVLAEGAEDAEDSGVGEGAEAEGNMV